MKVGVIMDPIEGINIHKDSTFAMLLAAQSKGWENYYMLLNDLFIKENTPMATMRRIQVEDDIDNWFQAESEQISALADLDVILMRKDPPFNMEYIYSTYILELAEKQGVLVVNRPGSLRDANEKLFIFQFPTLIAPTLVTRRAEIIREFIKQRSDIVIKPLDGMGGNSVFHIQAGDTNTSVIIETLTENGTRYAMAQKYIPEISQGDKRILLIDGEPIEYALARRPAAGETRGNLVAGATGKGVELSDHDRSICENLGPVLREKGLMFVGLDVIGDYLTEINVTSPTCIRELDKIFNLDIAGMLMDVIEDKIHC